MLRYVASRCGQALLVLWAAFTISFVLLQALPGDAIQIKFQNPDMGLSPAQIAEIRASYGADRPLLVQYVQALRNTLTGDFGHSVQAGVPVADQLRTALPPTLRLAGFGFALATLVALVLAAAASLAPFHWLRAGLEAIPSLLVSLPTFWLGVVLIQVVSFRLRLIPVIHPGPWLGLVLPVLTVSVPISAPLAQILMRSLEEVGRLPFVSVARAKGVSRTGVLWRHVALNALLPVLTISALLLGELIAGAVVTETVFGLSGIGQLTQQAVNNEDTSVLQAIVVLSATAFVLINLLVDLLYPVLDPRLRSRAGASA